MSYSIDEMYQDFITCMKNETNVDITPVVSEEYPEINKQEFLNQNVNRLFNIIQTINIHQFQLSAFFSQLLNLHILPTQLVSLIKAQNVIQNYWNTFNQRVNKRQNIDFSDYDEIEIYLVGDIEGDFTMIYNWLIDYKFINHNLEWIAAPNVFIIQLGDQIDSMSDQNKSVRPIERRSRSTEQHNIPDWYVIVLFDLLNVISNGHVLSVLGNHETMNVQQQYQYGKHRTNQMFSNTESRLFQILKRRPYYLWFYNILASHAGIHSTHLDQLRQILNDTQPISVGNFISKINSVSLQEFIPGTQPQNKELFDFVNHLLWNREYVNNQPASSFPFDTEFQSLIHVIGHNNLKSVMFCCTDICVAKHPEDFKTPVKLIKTDSGDLSRQCSGHLERTFLTNKGPEFFQLSEEEQKQQYIQFKNDWKQIYGHEFVDDLGIPKDYTTISTGFIKINSNYQIIDIKKLEYQFACGSSKNIPRINLSY